MINIFNNLGQAGGLSYNTCPVYHAVPLTWGHLSVWVLAFYTYGAISDEEEECYFCWKWFHDSFIKTVTC